MSDSASAHGPSTTWPRTSRPYTSTASGPARTASASSVSPDGSVNASTRVAGSQAADVRTSDVSRLPL